MSILDDAIDLFRRRTQEAETQARSAIVGAGVQASRFIGAASLPVRQGPRIDPGDFGRTVALIFGVAATPVHGYGSHAGPSLLGPSFAPAQAAASGFGGFPVGYLSPPFSAYPGGPAVVGASSVGGAARVLAAAPDAIAAGTMAPAGMYPAGYSPLGTLPDAVDRAIAGGGYVDPGSGTIPYGSSFGDVTTPLDPSSPAPAAPTSSILYGSAFGDVTRPLDTSSPAPVYNPAPSPEPAQPAAPAPAPEPVSSTSVPGVSSGGSATLLRSFG